MSRERVPPAGAVSGRAELLALELGELGELGFDLELTGFSEDEANALTPEVLPEGKTDPDEAPEPPAKPRSVLGDGWLLGKHRVYFGRGIH